MAPHVFVVAVAFGATIVLTGALHIDGYLDASDALFASVSPDRRLEIMRDPCHGTFAIASFAVLALFWAAALWSIAPARLPLTLAFAGTIVRLGVIVLACYVPYGRARARVEAFRARPSVSVLAASGVLCAILGWPLGLAALGGVACAALAFLVGVALVPRFGGGLTGDVYGLLITAGEVATLCVLGLVQAR